MPTFQSRVSEVRVTFFATDRDSRQIEKVTAADFAIVDNGRVVRNFRSFSPSDETGIEVVALVDLSGSVAARYRAALADIVQLISREQSIPEDNVSVLSFGGTHPAVLCSGGCHDPNAASKLLAVKSEGLTPLYDALTFAADFIAQHQRPGVRTVLILFSDGDDTISLRGPREAAESLINSGAVVYAVDISGSAPGKGARFLRWISEATGGRYFSMQDSAAPILKTVLDDLRASYVVTYALTDRQPGFHSLSLMPTHDLNLRFHSRDGYYYQATTR